MQSLVLAVIAAAIASTLTSITSLWIQNRTIPTPSTTDETTTRRLARDLVVISELLADRLAKIWASDGGPGPDDDNRDTVFHHVRESTEAIVRGAGASKKTALAIGALTAKRVRPGPITQLDADGTRPSAPNKGSR
tara:strand:- start:176 stop:583 length:408 start_codon:yes stop_codon:yes gene_type:complete